MAQNINFLISCECSQHFHLSSANCISLTQNCSVLQNGSEGQNVTLRGNKCLIFNNKNYGLLTVLMHNQTERLYHPWGIWRKCLLIKAYLVTKKSSSNFIVTNTNNKKMKTEEQTKSATHLKTQKITQLFEKLQARSRKNLQELKNDYIGTLVVNTLL